METNTSFIRIWCSKYTWTFWTNHKIHEEDLRRVFMHLTTSVRRRRWRLSYLIQGTLKILAFLPFLETKCLEILSGNDLNKNLMKIVHKSPCWSLASKYCQMIGFFQRHGTVRERKDFISFWNNIKIQIIC